MTVNEEATKRAEASSRHIAIVGKFSLTVGKSFETYKLTNAEDGIRRDFPFALKTSATEIKVNANEVYKALAVHVPAAVVMDENDKEVKTGALPISGTALEARFGTDRGDVACVELGGRLFADLKTDLDRLIPFSGPAFDRLLSEAVYFSYNANPKRRIHSDLRNIIYAGEFNRLITTYFRATDQDANRILQKAKEAFPANIYAEANPTANDTQAVCSELVAHIKVLRSWLHQAAPLKAKDSKAKNDRDVAPGESVLDVVPGETDFSRVLKDARIIDDPNATLRSLYQLYATANDKVTGISRSETLMAFIVRWMFSKLAPAVGDDPAKVRDAVFEEMYNRPGKWAPTNLTDKEREDLFTQYKTLLEQKHKSQYPEDEGLAAEAAREQFDEAEVLYHLLRNPERIFSSKDLLKQIGNIVLELAAAYIPGGKQVAAVRTLAQETFANAARAIDRLFESKEGRRVRTKANAPPLQAELGPVFAAWDKTFSETIPELIGSNVNLRKLGQIKLGLSDVLNSVAPIDDSEELFKTVLTKLNEREAEIVGSTAEFFFDAKTVIDEAGKILRRGTVEALEAAADQDALVGGGDTVGLPNPESQDATMPAIIPKGTQISAKELESTANQGALVGDGDTVGLPKPESQDAIVPIIIPEGILVPVEGLETTANQAALAGRGDTVMPPNPESRHANAPKITPEGTLISQTEPSTQAHETAQASIATSAETETKAKIENPEEASGKQVQVPAEPASETAGDNRLGPHGHAADPNRASEDPGIRRTDDGGWMTTTDLTLERLLDLFQPSEKERVKSVLVSRWRDAANKADMVSGFRSSTAADPSFRGQPPDNDTRAQKRKALMRAKLFAEFLLGTRKDQMILNRLDRSIMAGLSFELLRHTDPTDVRLAELLPAPSVPVAKALISTVYQAVTSQTDDLKDTLRSYFADVRDVTNLLSSLRQSGADGWVTFVNATIPERGNVPYETPYNFEPIYESANKEEIPPPGIVYITRQAFPPDGARTLAPISDKLKGDRPAPFWKNKDTKTTFIDEENPLAQMGWPLYVGRNFVSADLPSLTFDVEKLGTLILHLSGMRQDTDEKLGALADAYHEQTKENAGENTRFSQFWLTCLKRGDRLGPVLTSYTVAHAIAVRQIAKLKNDTKVLPDFGKSLEWAVEVIGKRFDPTTPSSADWLKKRIWWWNGKWAHMATESLGKFAGLRKSVARERFAVADEVPSEGASLEDLVDRFEMIHPR